MTRVRTIARDDCGNARIVLVLPDRRKRTGSRSLNRISGRPRARTKVAARACPGEIRRRPDRSGCAPTLQRVSWKEGFVWTLDVMVVALNQDTGKVPWRQTLGDHAAVVTTAEAWPRGGLRHNERIQGSQRCGLDEAAAQPESTLERSCTMSKFSQERRDALKSTCRLVTVTALASGAGVKAFAAGGAMPLAQAKGVPQVGDTFVFSAGPNKGKEVMVADVALDARPRWRWRRIRARASWKRRRRRQRSRHRSFLQGGAG